MPNTNDTKSRYVVDNIRDLNKPYSPLRDLPILPPQSDIRDDVTDEELDKAVLLHCKTSKEQLEELIQKMRRSR